MSDLAQPDPAAWPFDPQAIWRANPTDQLFAGAQPWTGDETFQITDLTDEESAAFWAAVNE